MALALDAPAKVNLHLEVKGRRPDGYHEIDTVLHPLDLHDTLCAELCQVPAGQPSIALEIVTEAGTGLPVFADADNLVCRAARAFFAATGITAGVRFHLHKRIPAGGGLGGGSSDAAAALRLLNALCGDSAVGNPLSPADLLALAVSLGADVAFFLVGGSQRGRGVGADLSPLPGIPRLHFVLILPSLGTATPAVYQNLRADLTSPPHEASIEGDSAFPDFSQLALPTGFRNDLEHSALELHPELMDLRRAIESVGFPEVCLAGSGSTFFIALEDHLECIDAMDRLAPLRRRYDFGLLQTESNCTPLRDPRLIPYPGPVGN